MRSVLAAAVALVAGVALGGMLPRAEVRRLEARIEALDEQACAPLLGSEIARAIQRAPPPAAPPDPTDPSEGAPPQAPPPEPTDGGTDPEDLEAARAVLAARRAQARAALIEGADPAPDQLEAFDLAVADMNAELRAIGEDLLARVHELGAPPPRSELYLYAADVLDVILETDARIQQALGDPDGVDPEALDPLSHLDPALVDVLLDLDHAGFDP